MPQTLLLADDSLTIQRVIELTFAGEDIKVVAVSDGDQAIAQLDTMPPDIVLADVGMPGRNGYDVAQHVKESPALAHIPVILLTGAFEPVDKAKANAVGCDAVLAKPFEPQLVIGRVRELLTRQSQAPPVPPAPEPAPALDQRVEDYFDRLDAAFANLTNRPTPAGMAPVEEPEPEPDLPITPQSFVVADELAAEPVERVEHFAPIEPFMPLEAAEPLAHQEPLELFAPLEPTVPSRVVEMPSTPRALPSLTDAFAAILSAEQSAPAVRPEWPPLPEPVAPPLPPEPVITDEVIDRIAKRVIEQLSDRVVRETVAEIASQVAERLVREEIERIKASVESGK